MGIYVASIPREFECESGINQIIKINEIYLLDLVQRVQISTLKLDVFLNALGQ